MKVRNDLAHLIYIRFVQEKEYYQKADSEPATAQTTNLIINLESDEEETDDDDDNETTDKQAKIDNNEEY